MTKDLESPTLQNASTRDGIVRVPLWYPRSSGEHTIEVDLMCVRVASAIRIMYDFDRDGYVILQDFAPLEEVDDREDWREAAFLPAWPEDQEPPPSEPQGPVAGKPLASKGPHKTDSPGEGASYTQKPSEEKEATSLLEVWARGLCFICWKAKTASGYFYCPECYPQTMKGYEGPYHPRYQRFLDSVRDGYGKPMAERALGRVLRQADAYNKRVLLAGQELAETLNLKTGGWEERAEASFGRVKVHINSIPQEYRQGVIQADEDRRVDEAADDLDRALYFGIDWADRPSAPIPGTFAAALKDHVGEQPPAHQGAIQAAASPAFSPGSTVSGVLLAKGSTSPEEMKAFKDAWMAAAKEGRSDVGVLRETGRGLEVELLVGSAGGDEVDVGAKEALGRDSDVVAGQLDSLDTDDPLVRDPVDEDAVEGVGK